MKLVPYEEEAPAEVNNLARKLTPAEAEIAAKDAKYMARPAEMEQVGWKDKQGYIKGQGKLKLDAAPVRLVPYVDDFTAARPEPGTAPQGLGAEHYMKSDEDWQNWAAGIGKSLTDIPLGAKQRFREFQNATTQWLPQPGDTYAQDLNAVNQEVAEKRQLDAPLMSTKAGAGGAFLGKAIPAVGLGLLPGGQGLAGSLLTGAGMGLLEPTSPDESVLNNTLFGFGGGAFGYALPRLAGRAGMHLTDSAARTQAANAARDATAAMARSQGYVIPPTQTNTQGVRGFINKTAEGLAGKLSTAQKASVKNQPVTNALIAKDLGLPVDQPLSIDALKGVRTRAGAAYNEVKKLGTIVTDKKFLVDLDDIVATTRNAEKDFPGLGDTKLEDIVKSLKQPQFQADNALAALRLIRNKTDAAYGQNDKTLGEAYRKASGVLEEMIERAAAKAGQPDLLANFVKARKDIAKSYTVESALNDATGNVNAVKLAAKLTSGKPMSGSTRDVARFAQGHPEAAKTLTSSIPGSSPLDWMAALGLGGTGALMGDMGTTAALSTAGILARPLVRTGLLSGPYQGLMGTPRYESLLGQALQNRRTHQGLRIGTMAGLPQLK